MKVKKSKLECLETMPLTNYLFKAHFGEDFEIKDNILTMNNNDPLVKEKLEYFFNNEYPYKDTTKWGGVLNMINIQSGEWKK